MKIPTLHQQMSGDVNKKLNSLRAQMNREVRQKCSEALERAKEIITGSGEGFRD